MKKLLSFVLALALALSLSVTAFAEDNQITHQSPDKKGSTNINYEVNSAYIVTIPESVTIGSETGSGTATVSAGGVKVGYDEQVVVKLTGINQAAGENSTTTGDEKFIVKTKEGAELEYTVKIGQTEVTVEEGRNTVLAVKSGLNNEKVDGIETGASMGSATLTFALADTAVVQYAGEYSGKVTFTVSVEKVPADSGDGGTGITDNP